MFKCFFDKYNKVERGYIVVSAAARMNFIYEMKIYTRFRVLKKIASNFENFRFPFIKNQKKRFNTETITFIFSENGQGFDVSLGSFLNFQEFFLVNFRPWELRGLNCYFSAF